MSSSSNSGGLGHLNSSGFVLDMYCFFSPRSSFIVIAFLITNILLLLPLSVFILHHGLKQRKQSSMNHSDCFTYHMVAIELIGVFGCFLSCCGICSYQFYLFLVGFYCFFFTWFGQILFQVLTCVDRYLAVVHPVLYLSLKGDRGVRIRNASVACTWFICSVGTSLLSERPYMVFHFSIVTSCLIIASFCSISVLHVLIRPSAAKQAVGRKVADQSKLRAFCTIVVILGVLVARFTLSLIWAVFLVVEENLDCLVVTADPWFNLPTSLVLPLLYLYKEKKMKCLT